MSPGARSRKWAWQPRSLACPSQQRTSDWTPGPASFISCDLRRLSSSIAVFTALAPGPVEPPLRLCAPSGGHAGCRPGVQLATHCEGPVALLSGYLVIAKHLLIPNQSPTSQRLPSTAAPNPWLLFIDRWLSPEGKNLLDSLCMFIILVLANCRHHVGLANRQLGAPRRAPGLEPESEPSGAPGRAESVCSS